MAKAKLDLSPPVNASSAETVVMTASSTKTPPLGGVKAPQASRKKSQAPAEALPPPTQTFTRQHWIIAASLLAGVLIATLAVASLAVAGYVYSSKKRTKIHIHSRSSALLFIYRFKSSFKVCFFDIAYSHNLNLVMPLFAMFPNALF